MTVTATYFVSGMTCGHCVSAVSEEIGAIPGVHDVAIDLTADAPSPVVVTSEAPLAAETVEAAVDEAGYVVVDPVP